MTDCDALKQPAKAPAVGPRKIVNRVRFLRAYIHTPSAQRRVSIKYPAGHTGLVTRECADQAIAAGAAEPIIKPAKVEV